ncbi:hypothetical protein JR316_0000437 [Psilocybe cubensis]|uniref:Uncharacterized protein n=2 Tax=Psilocybe cubensis TaxID=181762 RepID=A0A8H8CQB4_PSICU|nr:hypothetical protein JR316_0000437 [Psilocybe cubensis]KAH9486373.1 hypothetical protein JR316_0000437 [Psilocybe cubensis]
MAESPNSQPTDNTLDSLALYTRSLHNYTLALWTESRRIAEEKARSEGSPTVQSSSVHSPTSNEIKEKIEVLQLTPSTSSVDTDVLAPTNHPDADRQEDATLSG